MVGYDELWLVGDNFMAKTYRDHVRNRSADFFMKKYFEVLPFCNSRYNSNNRNFLSRLYNTMAHAVKEKVKLPRYIVIVLDNDIIDELSYFGYGMCTLMGEWIDFLAKNFKELCDERKKSLPLKAARADYPLIYWVMPPHHAHFTDNPEAPNLTAV